jgi:hypothetical protein
MVGFEDGLLIPAFLTGCFRGNVTEVSELLIPH